MSVSPPGKRLGSQHHDHNITGPSMSCSPQFLLTNDFDKQIKLVEESMTATKKDLINEQKDTKTETKGKVQTIRMAPNQNSQKRQPQYTNSSRIFRYDAADDDDDEAPGVKVPTPSPIHPLVGIQDQSDDIDSETGSRSKMLMSWYMAGYHTGYYEAMLKLKRKTK